MAVSVHKSHSAATPVFHNAPRAVGSSHPKLLSALGLHKNKPANSQVGWSRGLGALSVELCPIYRLREKESCIQLCTP